MLRLSGGEPRRSGQPASGRPLAARLGVRGGSHLLVLGAPDGLREDMDLPAGVRVSRRPGRVPADVMVLFTRERRELERRLGPLVARVRSGDRLWLAWPKRASGLSSDLTDGVLRQMALPHGLVDVRVCAIDATWSGLCFMRRRASPG